LHCLKTKEYVTENQYKMKKILLFAILICLVLAVIAQPKSQRRIYLWDVTLSMLGKKCVHGEKIHDPDGKNIYENVVRFLTQEIESITDENTEIVVLPFQENILVNPNDWKVKATNAGKKEIIQKIKNYPEQGCSWTNIVRPVERVQAEIISPDKNNILVLLTDGVQSETHGGKSKLIECIRSWEKYAELNSAYCLYLMLGEGKDAELEKIIGKTVGITCIDEPVPTIDLQPAELIKINLKDDKAVSVPLTYKKSNPLPDNIKVKLISNDTILNINQTVIIKDGKITFDIEYAESYETLKRILPEIMRLPIAINLVNGEEILKDEGKIVFLTTDKIELELINKPEKTLKISIKR
jgi:hypothetical protein